MPRASSQLGTAARGTMTVTMSMTDIAATEGRDRSRNCTDPASARSVCPSQSPMVSVRFTITLIWSMPERRMCSASRARVWVDERARAMIDGPNRCARVWLLKPTRPLSATSRTSPSSVKESR